MLSSHCSSISILLFVLNWIKCRVAFGESRAARHGILSPQMDTVAALAMEGAVGMVEAKDMGTKEGMEEMEGMRTTTMVEEEVETLAVVSFVLWAWLTWDPVAKCPSNLFL